jgi:hypothetical protein
MKHLALLEDTSRLDVSAVCKTVRLMFRLKNIFCSTLKNAKLLDSLQYLRNQPVRRVMLEICLKCLAPRSYLDMLVSS